MAAEPVDAQLPTVADKVIVAVSAGISAKVTFCVALQPYLSVTVTEYTPAATLAIV